MLRAFEEKEINKILFYAQQFGVSAEATDRAVILDEDDITLGIALFFINEKECEIIVKSVTLRDNAPETYYDFLLRSTLNIFKSLAAEYNVRIKQAKGLEKLGFAKVADGFFEVINKNINFSCGCKH